YAGWWGYLTTGGPVTISIGSPAVVTWTKAGLPPAGRPPQGALVGINTSGTLPTGLVNNTQGCRSQQCYFLFKVNGNTANLATDKSCTRLISTSGTQQGTHTAYWIDPQATIIEDGAKVGLGWDVAAGNAASQKATVQNNIFAYAAAVGSQIRPGGTITNNLY